MLSCDNLRHNGDVVKNALLSFARAKDAEPGGLDRGQRHLPVLHGGPHHAGGRPGRRGAAQRRDGPRRRGADLRRGLHPVGRRGQVSATAGRRWRRSASSSPTTSTPTSRSSSGCSTRPTRMMAFPGILLGHRIVHLAMKDPNVDALLDQFLSRDAGPLLDAPPSHVGRPIQGHAAQPLPQPGDRRPAAAHRLRRRLEAPAVRPGHGARRGQGGRRPSPHRLPARLLHRISARRGRQGRDASRWSSPR